MIVVVLVAMALLLVYGYWAHFTEKGVQFTRRLEQIRYFGVFAAIVTIACLALVMVLFVRVLRI